MASKQPFSRRIVIGFTLMTLVVSGLFSVGLVVTVHFIESHLVSEELDRELSLLLQRDDSTQQPVFIDSITRFYSSRSVHNPLPERYRDLSEGFSEVLEGKEAFYVYTRTVAGERYQLVQEQHEFEQREQTLYGAVVLGFFLSVVAAWILGQWMARKVMAPVTRLAHQVRYRDQIHPASPPLALDYPDDEVGHLAAAFDNALDKLLLALSRERLFTSDVSHELRTPLMIIASSCELLNAGSLDLTQRDQVDRITRAALEMKELVQTFLMLARTESRDGRPEKTSLETLAREQYQRWQGAMTDKGLGFELVVEHQDGGSYHRTFLSVVIANLLRNALHYTERGQVRLVVARGVVKVEDTGIGIPVERQQEIFEPFVRGPEVRGEGLGLGLSLVKRICEHQGWQISIEAMPEGGSCFQVCLG
ncbi:MAG: HAMP domain-containing histidine kinase [Gammaproteobacteria bacterium]|nr:MAG: HAMP domain-containing histidine kinase [Gammaproteobacteria bacterium]